MIARIRLFLIARNNEARIRRECRPHVPSVHMTSYPTQPEEMRLGPFYVAVLLSIIGVVAAVNYYTESEPQTRACTPVLRKMT
jgi:hypothetical protein